ncbi:MAG: hypothetical protein AAFQ88_16425, partial [Pseudomonadota bacterium]
MPEGAAGAGASRLSAASAIQPAAAWGCAAAGAAGATLRGHGRGLVVLGGGGGREAQGGHEGLERRVEELRKARRGAAELAQRVREDGGPALGGCAVRHHARREAVR